MIMYITGLIIAGEGGEEGGVGVGELGTMFLGHNHSRMHMPFFYVPPVLGL